ncbi:topoisomerase acting in meiosis [Panus rudis PR-1116 ss-1]|nr:topoisomerase acting in meiosis [Panus rudis PR-1116 ss-1]
MNSADSPTLKTIAFPQKTSRNNHLSMARLFRVIDTAHEALHEDVPITKRDIYYRDVGLFKTQSVVDKEMGLSRGELHVRASPKGLFCGSALVIYMHSGERVCGADSESCLIPVAEDIERFDVDDKLSWVLVVEKEAVFQTLVHLHLTNHPALPGLGIMITGKGYPDIATRQLVSTLSRNLPSRVPILGFVDGDPYGLDILSVYRYGSSSMLHENDLLTATRIRWAGVIGNDLVSSGIDYDHFLPLTKHDEKKARVMLTRPYLPLRWKKELQRMLFIRRKAEIEVLAFTKDVSSPDSKVSKDNKTFSKSTNTDYIPDQRKPTHGLHCQENRKCAFGCRELTYSPMHDA